jgi:hypothetical protein
MAALPLASPLFTPGLCNCCPHANITRRAKPHLDLSQLSRTPFSLRRQALHQGPRARPTSAAVQ